MIVEIGTGAVQFLFWESLFQIFGIDTYTFQCMVPREKLLFVTLVAL
jgi:hypothetical protein